VTLAGQDGRQRFWGRSKRQPAAKASDYSGGEPEQQPADPDQRQGAAGSHREAGSSREEVAARPGEVRSRVEELEQKRSEKGRTWKKN
jgi:hypothetical protein